VGASDLRGSWQAFLDLPDSRGHITVQTIGGAMMRVFGATPDSWLVLGYVKAVERFREQAVIGSDSAREVYPPLFEALNWAHSLWDTWFRLVEPQDRHLDGLRYVRDRCHHQLASAIYPDAAIRLSLSSGRWVPARAMQRSRR